MSNGITLEFEVHFKRGAGGKRLLRPGPDPSQDGPVVTGGKIPRIARLMALAVRFEGLVRRGEVDDYAAIAELGRVTRARVAQITNLLNLAPDIQEALLFHPPVPGDRAAVSERELREICALICWDEQRERWRELNDAFRAEPARRSTWNQPSNSTREHSRNEAVRNGRSLVKDVRVRDIDNPTDTPQKVSLSTVQLTRP